MSKLSTFFGVLGVLFFVGTTIISGNLYPNYNHISQMISESYAIDAPYNEPLRYYGYIPSGMLILLFSYFSYKSLPKNTLGLFGFMSFGLAYGFGTIVCSIFNCDAGCNPKLINPSISQFIHNITGMLTYLLVPITLLIIGTYLNVYKELKSISIITFLFAGLIILFLVLFMGALETNYKGLLQRLLEGTILTWILVMSFTQKNLINNSNF